MDSVRENCAVSIAYTMSTEIPDGPVKERPMEELEFIFGVERQIPTLEQALEGAGVGQRFSLRIPPEEIYGAYDASLIREIPKEGLIRQRIREGTYYRQMKKGSLVSFKVLEIRPDTVLADFNAPMAGISASMEVRVTGIREADASEIEAAREAHRKKSIGCG
ncbi:MAG: FKBP-type peptidyl-prolyl cis-trans isomerase [Desulfatiglandaceae bacterium]